MGGRGGALEGGGVGGEGNGGLGLMLTREPWEGWGKQRWWGGENCDLEERARGGGGGGGGKCSTACRAAGRGRSRVAEERTGVWVGE